MLDLRGELTAAERVVPAVDTSDHGRARELFAISKEAGARIVKVGLEVISAPTNEADAIPEVGTSPELCAAMVEDAGLDWVADLKLNDIPNTVAKTVENYARLDHAPSAITIHTQSGVDSMKAAQEVADEAGITMLGVTELTTTTPEQLKTQLDNILERLGIELSEKRLKTMGVDAVRKAFVYARVKDAKEAGIGGLVASAKELIDPISTIPGLQVVTMIPGTRLAGAETHDQKMVGTPYQAMLDGATLLVHGRAITGSDNPGASFAEIAADMQAGMDARAQLLAGE